MFNSRLECKHQTLFKIKMAKIDPLFMTYIAHIREYPLGVTFCLNMMFEFNIKIIFFLNPLL